MKHRNIYLIAALLLLPFMAAQATRYYVSLQGTEGGAGSSWANATTLDVAIGKATSGDEIWMRGYSTPSRDSIYRTEGLTLPAGVAIYGGFAGTETSPGERRIVESKAYRMEYRTVISGDAEANDAVDATNLIFPANTSRRGNATHVIKLMPGQGNATTTVNGITIARGHATGTDDAGRGGGIIVSGRGNYLIERCFFIENYATEGGALYVPDGAEGRVNLCGFFNNAAGERGVVSNSGGAIYLGGTGAVANTAVFNNENGGVLLGGADARVVNSTVTRNTGAGIDGPGNVDNTVVWGNTSLYLNANAHPDFNNSAYPEATPGVTDDDGNVYLAEKNNEDDGPHFSSPSIKTGFDTDFNILTTLYPLWTWQPMEATPLVDAGRDASYSTSDFGSYDLGMNARQAGTIDIGAFEFQPVQAGRIRYVRPEAHGTGDGSSWANASADLQRMIDYLADNNPQGLPGEVWVAAGEYEPQSQLISGTGYSASFRMRDGISVYGGFSNDSPEDTKAGRKLKDGGMPWQYVNETVLQGAYYDHANLRFSGNRWTLTGDSRHVVWFAPMAGEPAFSSVTTLDGVTIMGGYAQGDTGLSDFKTDRGAGVYMDGDNTRLVGCTVKENYATGNGGGVWLRGGRVQSSIIYNNNSDANGGAVYVEDRGLVHRSMLVNNSARNGAGIYLDNIEPAAGADDHPEYLVLSTCVVTNNTASGNAAVYCSRGGVLLQNTVANNSCVTATDATDPNASQTGGIYVDEYALVANSVLWNNRMGTTPRSAAIPMYARNPSATTVRFLYNAISGTGNAVWNNTLQEQTLQLIDSNIGSDGAGIGPRFIEPDAGTNFDLETSLGVREGWKDGIIDYFWQPVSGSGLWARGMAIGQLPQEVVLAPEIDIAGELFNQKPGVGAFHVNGSEIVPALEGNNLVLYIDAECTDPEHDGSSWDKAYRSLNDAISFFAGLTIGSNVSVREVTSSGVISRVTIGNNITSLEIRVLEGNLWPRYAFVNDDPKTATVDIMAMASDKPLTIRGGYHRTGDASNPVERDWLTYRSQLNGNNGGASIEDGIYHVVTVEAGANVTLDGFHIINGYAAGSATLHYGAGMIAYAGADVTVSNCIFENNTADAGAAIDARNATLTMQNCVVNNNTNTNTAAPVVNCPASSLTMQHVTIVNNIGAAVMDEKSLSGTSFSKGNTRKNSIDVKLATTGAEGAANFANPTNRSGATLGFDTYLGGYSSFRPLTSSAPAADLIINKGDTSLLTHDIMGNERNLGGVPDLGAYEAELPRAGKVIYVRSYNTVWNVGEELDGSPSLAEGGDGSSWDAAINGNVICNVLRERDENFYATANGNYILATEDNYTGTYAFDTDFYADFWSTDDNNTDNTYSSSGQNTITNDRTEQYVSGLQYAVEKAAEMNENLQPGEDSVEVWVGAGIYTDYKGFVIRDRVTVLGGFPKSGVPGESDRHPLLSQYIPANEADDSLVKTDYETILQIRKETPVTWNGYYGTPTSIVTNLGNTVRRRYVLFQPDVCLPTWAPANNYGGTGGRDNQYRYPGSGSTLIDNTNYQEYTGATWDGFTVRHGYINRYFSNRDGGAGVRVFRGVTLQNMVITNNCNRHNNRNRGGGLYMDGLNSRINNSFILNNYIGTAGESMGGGAYMIVGTGYNLVVANNYSSHRGGGIFMESATFFNNTIAYNYSPDPGASSNNEGGSGLFQYADGNQRLSNLELYNCIFYGNYGVSISSNTPGTFNEAYNCYVQGTIYTGLSDKFPASNDNQIGLNLANPFDSGNNAQDENNYRLSSSNDCVNGGTEIVDGEELDLPSTDMDYTNRIKDCAIDIGAYERDNEDSTFPDANGVYYVTWTGFGNASGNSPENAACADKLQTVLNAAGVRAAGGQTAIVKVAGYTDGDFVYHANTLSSTINPQSYSYVIPEGVTLMGGYFEGTFTGGNYNNDGWDNADDDHKRDPMAYRTVLSAVAVPAQGSTVTQEVQGYHAVTFGAWPGTEPLSKEAVIDGLWLTDGSATSMAGTGNPATMGGGAIVPAGAHVRNCVVSGCEAVNGGGLYLMAGGTVSGTAIIGNLATVSGGGIYADNGNAADGNRAHIISCTIADNEATTEGGGLRLEDGAAMSLNTVIWGNTAPQDKNVGGVATKRFADTKWNRVFGEKAGGYFPFNDCFVESHELPSDFTNSSMESDSAIYFTDSYRRLKEFSPLIKHGTLTDYQDSLQTVFGVAAQDMQGIDRAQVNMARLDAGAFAYDGGVIPTELFTRLFVSQTANVKLKANADMLKCLGRSFYTAFSTLDDALAYISEMRSGGNATDDTPFEILMGGGTYKPANARYINEGGHNQRLYSFVVPDNVSIYGGFSGTEDYSCGIDSIPAEGGDIDVEAGGDIDGILTARGFSDFNNNGIDEPWELAAQTILSGNINVSAEVRNAYHVLYSEVVDPKTAKGIVLDGLTVMDGETSKVLTDVSVKNASGRGGGLYSDGVPYTISRCRFMNNFGVRGGAVYVRDARLNVIGSVFSGNGTVSDATTEEYVQKPRGGAIFLSGHESYNTSLYAVNSLFVNNETIGEGGAIGTNYAEGVVTNVDPLLDIMNCTFARNKAETNAVIYNHNGKSNLTNTLIWGNESGGYNDQTDAAQFTISHSASDYDYAKIFSKGENGNILLDLANFGTNGPRFTNPATTAGVGGNDARNLWNPAAISVVTDAGDGTEHTTTLQEGETNHVGNAINGAYAEWFTANGISEIYMNGNYDRYSGPRGERNEELCKPIDIGLYEYQYVSDFSTMPEIYVDTLSRGDGSGNSWINATDDLRGAIVGAANPTDNYGPRVVYVRDGDYSWNRISAGSAYLLNMGTYTENESLTLRGSCTGSGDQQDFSRQTVVRAASDQNATTQQLMNVAANSKTVAIEGFTFINTNTGGKGITASTGDGGKLTLKNCAFRLNAGAGVDMASNAGSVLIYNTLFADGGTGLAGGDAHTTLVNTTFANNSVADLTGSAAVYNSVSWNNAASEMPDIADHNNKVFGVWYGEDVDAATANNEDIQGGPNFVDPLNTDKESRDYHIRPSLTLLNNGSNVNYSRYVLGNGNQDIPDTERDLGNNRRMTDGSIDIGAYEYEAPLRPIVYVKADLTVTDPDGSSWDKALADLQGAADLAGIYANNNQGESGYVFVHSNIDGQSLRLTLPNTKVYGGMNDEQTSAISQDADGNWHGVTEAVSDLLSARSGLLERANRTELQSVAVAAADAVSDGFVVTGDATVTNGYLATSIVNGDVSGKADGMLYNTLVYGGVSGAKTVNVTATGDITAAEGSANNRGNATETNAYVADEHWNYQLMETSADIDGDTDGAATKACIAAVGHSRDIAGNLRIRNAVDNGCFETWDINYDNAAVTDEDYPHGQSVVYVRSGKELLLQRDYAAATPFCPGVLLLEHRAGLRGNGKNIALNHVIVEREVPAHGVDMAAVPFNAAIEKNGGVALKEYDGDARAAHDYAFDSVDGAWNDFAGTPYTAGTGLLLDNTAGDADARVRFVGQGQSVYTENGGTKSVTLQQHNHSEAWSGNTAGNRFTHKENMGWNLFGSPYLCAMNYADMEYGRVIYGYQGGADGNYVTIKTYGDDGNDVDGHIPAGDAVFTQTATLGNSETFSVEPGSGIEGAAYAGTESLEIAVTRAGQTRADGAADVLQLNAVAEAEARTDFDMTADGVKWMGGAAVPQIYATQGAGRYSLLSAVSREGSVAVGLTLPESGTYTIGLPEDCAAEGYEAVTLTDAATGRTTDLLAGGYDFSVAGGGDVAGRFTISFRRMAADRAADDITVRSDAPSTVTVSGLEQGDVVRVYSASGVLAAQTAAASQTERMTVRVQGVALVEVTRGGTAVKTAKVRVR